MDSTALLRKLGLVDSEIDVYLAMAEGATRVAEIIKTTGRKRPTVYYALESLRKRGLISKTGRSESGYRAEAPDKLVVLVEERKREADGLLADTIELAAHLRGASAREERSAVAFFEGKEAVRRVVMETLYCKKKHIDVVAPNNNFFWQVGRAFVEEYIDTRNERAITTRSLWERSIDAKTYRHYYKAGAEVRTLPKIMHGAFKSTVMLYDDKTLYISSLRSGYALLVTSKEHHDTMKAWFDGLWSIAKPHARRP